jgi:hypothetical protein
MSDKTLKTWRRLGGEYLREISVLVLVFGFLDGFRDNSLDVETVLLIPVNKPCGIPGGWHIAFVKRMKGMNT